MYCNVSSSELSRTILRLSTASLLNPLVPAWYRRSPELTFDFDIDYYLARREPFVN